MITRARQSHVDEGTVDENDIGRHFLLAGELHAQGLEPGEHGGHPGRCPIRRWRPARRSLSPLPRFAALQHIRAQGNALASAQDGVSALGDAPAAMIINRDLDQPGCKDLAHQRAPGLFGAILADAEGLEPVMAVAAQPARSPRPRGSPRYARRRNARRCGQWRRGIFWASIVASNRITPPRHRSQWPQGADSSPKLGRAASACGIAVPRRARPVRPGVAARCASARRRRWIPRSAYGAGGCLPARRA